VKVKNLTLWANREGRTQLIVLEGKVVMIHVMPRRPRICPAGICFHVINRAVAPLPLFEKEGDYEAFERVLALAHGRVPLPILSYTLMPNHSYV